MKLCPPLFSGLSPSFRYGQFCFWLRVDITRVASKPGEKTGSFISESHPMPRRDLLSPAQQALFLTLPRERGLHPAVHPLSTQCLTYTGRRQPSGLRCRPSLRQWEATSASVFDLATPACGGHRATPPVGLDKDQGEIKLGLTR